MAGEHAFNIKFVSEVEKRPELYNYNLPQYSRKDLVEKGWAEVGMVMHMSASECKERWKNLRSVFVRNLKPLLNGSGLKKRKPYYLMDAMQFALPFVKTNAPGMSGNVSILGLLESQYDEEVDDMQENSGSSQQAVEGTPALPTLSQQPTSCVDPSSAGQNQQASPGQPQLSNQNKIKPGTKRTDVDASFMDLFQTKKSRLFTPKENDLKISWIKSFLDSLLPELEPFSEQQLKKFRRNILQLIDEIGAETSQSTNLSHYPMTYAENVPINVSQHDQDTQDDYPNDTDDNDSDSDMDTKVPEIVMGFKQNNTTPPTTPPASKKMKAEPQAEVWRPQASRGDTPKDECQVFASHIAVQLRKLTAPSCVLAQQDIQSVLTRYRMADLRLPKPVLDIINGCPDGIPEDPR